MSSNHAHETPDATPVAFWEERYASAHRVWSGNPNATMAAVAADLTPATALDLGCGEGADAIWLAGRGARVTGVDISPTAIARATAAASAAGLTADNIRFVAADLAQWSDDERYDLVTASFLQSPVALPRVEVLRQAAARVNRGGHLLLVSHAAMPPWASGNHHHTFVPPAEEAAALGLDASEWTTVLAEVKSRAATGPNGQQAVLDDGVVLVQRAH